VRAAEKTANDGKGSSNHESRDRQPPPRLPPPPCFAAASSTSVEQQRQRGSPKRSSNSGEGAAKPVDEASPPASLTFSSTPNQQFLTEYEFVGFDNGSLQLGEGSFGRILPARRTSDGTGQKPLDEHAAEPPSIAVCPLVLKLYTQKKEKQQDVHREREALEKIMREVREQRGDDWHSFLVRYRGSYEHKYRLYSLFERCEGDLRRLMREGYFKDNFDRQWICMLQCACGLYFIGDSLGMAHRDVKPENILYERGEGDQITFKLADFGLRREMAPGASSTFASKAWGEEE
jgi:hypothetical protein